MRATHMNSAARGEPCYLARASTTSGLRCLDISLSIRRLRFARIRNTTSRRNCQKDTRASRAELRRSVAERPLNPADILLRRGVCHYRSFFRSNVAVIVFDSGVVTSTAASSEATSFASYSSQTVAPVRTAGVSLLGVEYIGLFRIKRAGLDIPRCPVPKRKLSQQLSDPHAR